MAARKRTLASLGRRGARERAASPAPAAAEPAPDQAEIRARAAARRLEIVAMAEADARRVEAAVRGFLTRLSGVDVRECGFSVDYLHSDSDGPPSIRWTVADGPYGGLVLQRAVPFGILREILDAHWHSSVLAMVAAAIRAGEPFSMGQLQETRYRLQWGAERLERLLADPEQAEGTPPGAPSRAASGAPGGKIRPAP